MSKLTLQIVMGLLGIIPVATGLLGLLGVEDPFYVAVGVPPIVLLDTNLRFYSGVWLLFDPAVLVRQPLQVLAVVTIIVAGKPAAALCIVLALGRPLRTALTVSAGLAQVGELSFILAGLGVALGLLPPEGQSLVVAGALLSITLNPLAFYAVGRWTPADRPNQALHLTPAATQVSGSSQLTAAASAGKL
jgi:hypothetical protein